MSFKAKKVIIIGAGPAGLTAAYELSKHTGYDVIVYEATDGVGGISRTFNYKGNRIDIGGHRFFSKSDKVMRWWQDMLPMQKLADDIQVTYQQKTTGITASDGPDPDQTDDVLLVRPRLSRIYFLRKFFDYPISLSVTTLKNLGFVKVVTIGISYFAMRLFPIRKEKNLEEFFINRFGGELYRTFFKDYTEKVWGIPPSQISAEWGRQRIKGLSITTAIANAIKKFFTKDTSVSQKNTETSLIEQFLYPKFGPGHMWETVQKKAEEHGVVVKLNNRVVGFDINDSTITAVRVRGADNTTQRIEADYVISTMPVSQLISGMGDTAPAAVQNVASHLKYRAFVTVGVLLKKLKVTSEDGGLIHDTWIYIQERDVKIGRIQIFNNWSPYLVKDPHTVWIGLEYFCDEGDEMWEKSDEDMIDFALEELERIDFIDQKDFLDAVVIRVPKTYPTYFGAYDHFQKIRDFVDTIPNLFLVGRNGMHRYNNQDHSMLTAMAAVDNIVTGNTHKAHIWDINTEQEYHEEK